METKYLYCKMPLGDEHAFPEQVNADGAKVPTLQLNDEVLAV